MTIFETLKPQWPDLQKENAIKTYESEDPLWKIFQKQKEDEAKNKHPREGRTIYATHILFAKVLHAHFASGNLKIEKIEIDAQKGGNEFSI